MLMLFQGKPAPLLQRPSRLPPGIDVEFSFCAPAEKCLLRWRKCHGPECKMGKMQSQGVWRKMRWICRFDWSQLPTCPAKVIFTARSPFSHGCKALLELAHYPAARCPACPLQCMVGATRPLATR